PEGLVARRPRLLAERVPQEGPGEVARSAPVESPAESVRAVQPVVPQGPADLALVVDHDDETGRLARVDLRQWLRLPPAHAVVVTSICPCPLSVAASPRRKVSSWWTVTRFREPIRITGTGNRSRSA